MSLISFELIRAVKNNDFDKVKTLVSNNQIDFSVVDTYDRNALSNALVMKNIEISKYLLEVGHPISNTYIKNTLVEAINTNDASLVKLVISKGADVNVNIFNNQYPLFETKYCSVEIIEILLEAGAKIDIMDSNLENFLFYMVNRRERKIIEYLLKNNIEKNQINANGMTAIMVAVSNNDLDLVKYLYINGCTVIDTNASSSLISAIDNNNQEMFDYLITKKAKFNKIFNGKLVPLVRAAQLNIFEMVKILLNKGANPDLFVNSNSTALYYTVKNNNPEMTRYLLEYEASYELKGFSNSSAIELAYELKTPEIVEIFDQLVIHKCEELKNLTCFDEIEHSEYPINEYMKIPFRIIIKNGDNFKGYDRKNILNYLQMNGKFYSQERISKTDIDLIRATKNTFFELINTGGNEMILIPYEDNAFISKFKV
jgi:ankyrin repeat protein